MSGRGRLGTGLTPAAGAAVMSTGILSTATESAGLTVLSWLLLALAVAGGLVLGTHLVVRWATDRAGWLADAATPASLTGVAATTVIGGRVTAAGWTGPAWLLLAVAALLWVVLLPRVLRHRQVPTVGGSFLVCVATQGLAVLSATLAGAAGSRPALSAGVAAFLLGLVLYAGVLARFDWRQLAVGAGDQWVAAGALAITSLAGAHLVLAADRLGTPGRVVGPLRALDLAVWGLTLGGYAVLLACELRWPRRHYDVRRWATVFPLGMTAAAGFAVAEAERLPALARVGQVLLWPALAAWVLTAAGAAAALLRRGPAAPG
ncbi:Tellurite resistance protein TehA [Geodermatophilus telluris]|uniref:Tellurite resistance protein TehA n=1 Tax=Geodermatophilus telluris TaxID=1190417 RepID=A0A1G6TMN9_9ACTN|nr:Tellurite resistance protein TehA [Geodermatophilus telluris]